MFKIKKIKKIKWPVTINEPQDGGGKKEQTFTLELELISQNEYDAFYAEGGEKDIGLIRRVVTGFGADLCDESGNPLEFNGENKEELVTTAYIRNGIINAYINCLYGKAAAAKN